MTPSQQASLNWLMRRMAQLKAEHAHDDEEEGATLEKLTYLRGELGQQDRTTVWARGAGKLEGTGAGGLVEGWLENE